jgi:hypothetical protein
MADYGDLCARLRSRAWEDRHHRKYRDAAADAIEALVAENAELKSTKPTVPNPCVYCKTPIFGSYVGAGDGTMRDGGKFAHPECYYRHHLDLAQRELSALREWKAKVLAQPTAEEWSCGTQLINRPAP